MLGWQVENSSDPLINFFSVLIFQGRVTNDQWDKKKTDLAPFFTWQPPTLPASLGWSCWMFAVHKASDEGCKKGNQIIDEKNRLFYTLHPYFKQFFTILVNFLKCTKKQKNKQYIVYLFPISYNFWHFVKVLEYFFKGYEGGNGYHWIKAKPKYYILVSFKVLDHTRHTLLVGEKATLFAESFGTANI